MADFTDALFERLMQAEGRVYSDHPWDPGGPTNRGVTLATARELGLDLDHDGDVDADDVRLIDDPTARAVALRAYWDRYRCGQLADQDVAERYFLGIYNTPLAASLSLQRACRACGRPVPIDGAVGPATIAAANACDPRQLVVAFRSELAGEYRLIAARTHNPTPLAGWENRAYS